MARGYSKTEIIGNIGRDGELKYLPSGDPVLNFTVAVNGKQGDTQYTDWYNVSVWGKLAESIGQYVRKGDQIFVSGSLRVRPYESNGETRFSLDLRAQDVQLLGGRGEGNGSAPAPAGDSNDIPF